MDENETHEAGKLTVIQIPADKVQQVIEFVEGLDTSESDVTGHMISLGGGFGGGLGAKMSTSTNCLSIQTGKQGMDLECLDTDTIVTHA
ncbi:MAG TPA: hypothetical protein VHV31_10880 [Nitrolancea sp.]|nr:hypothetical protein [Nitrolancea sp.]